MLPCFKPEFLPALVAAATVTPLRSSISCAEMCRLLRDTLRVVVCLGHYAWQALWPQLADSGYAVPRPRPVFGHGVEVAVAHAACQQAEPGLSVLGCYHPSQQNTFTGKVTESMLDAVFSRARDLSR